MRTLARAELPELATLLGISESQATIDDLPQPEPVTQSITCFSSFEEVATLWRGFEARATGSVYQRFDWCRAWFDVAQTKAPIDPLIVVWSLEGRTALLLPLYVRRAMGGLRIAGFMGDDHANVRLPLMTQCGIDRLRMIHAGRKGGVVNRISAAIKAEGLADYLLLDAMPEWLDGDINILTSGERASSSTLLFSAELSDDFEALKAERRPVKSQRKMRKNLRKIQEIGEPRLVQITSSDELDAMLDVFFQQKGARLEGAHVHNSFDEAHNQQFLRQLAHRSLESGAHTFDLYALMVNDEPIALAGGGVHGDRFSMGVNSMTSDPRFAPHSPGRLSVDRAVELFCERGLKLFDLGLGENEYKRMWCSPVDLHDVGRALTWRGHALGAALSARRTVKATIKRWPPAYHLAKRVQYQLQR